MKNVRKGLGKGLGMGYKNILPLDSHIHSLSAKGISSKVISLVRVPYGKKDTPKKDREYIHQLGSSPVGTIKEWKAFGKKSGVDKLHVIDGDDYFYVDIDAKGSKKRTDIKKYKKIIKWGFEDYPDATHVAINLDNLDDWDFFNAKENPSLVEEYKNTKPYIVVSKKEFKKNSLNAKRKLEEVYEHYSEEELKDLYFDANSKEKRRITLELKRRLGQKKPLENWQYWAKGKNYNMMKEIDQLEKMAEKEISESRYYPENQKIALKRFFKQARTLVSKKGSVGIKGSREDYDEPIKNPNDLYKFWKKFDTFGVSITGRMTGNQVFRKKYGNETVRAWYKPIYEETTKSFNKALGQALKVMR